MSSLAHRTMTRLLSEAIARGDVVVQGGKVLRNGQRVLPRLGFEREPAAVSSGPGIRLGSGHHNDDVTMRQSSYAPLPASRLVHEDPAKAQQAERSRQAAQRAAVSRRQTVQATPWPAGGAPVLEPALTRRDGR